MKRALKYAIPVAAIIAQGIDEPAEAGAFLKFEAIPGESQDEAHKGEIDVLAWSWGVSNTGIVIGGGGSTGTKSTMTSIKVIKSVDTATPQLVLKAATGEHIPEAILFVTRNTGNGEEEYMKLTLNDLIVSKVSHGGKAGEAGTAETISLDFTQIKVEYRIQKGPGDWDTWQEACWDRELNKSC